MTLLNFTGKLKLVLMKITTIYHEQGWILLSNTQLGVTPRVDLCPWAKPVPQMNLPLLQAGLIQFSLTLEMCSPYGPQGLYSLPQCMEVLFGRALHTMLSSPDVYEAVFEMSPIVQLTSLGAAVSQLVFQGPGCCSRWWHEAQGVSSHTVAVLLSVSMWCLPWQVWVRVMESICQTPLYFSFNHYPPYHRGLFTCLICWVAAGHFHVLVTGKGDEVFSAVWVWLTGFTAYQTHIHGDVVSAGKAKDRKEGEVRHLGYP